MNSPTETASVLLREESVVCPTGGGFTKTEWAIRVHDGWLSIGDLLRRRRVGPVSIALESADDPHREVTRGPWGDRPAGVYYRIEVRVEAPIGTRLRRRVWTPIRDSRRPVWHECVEDELELRGEDRLVSPRLLAERAARKAQPPPPLVPLSTTSTLDWMGSLLSRIGAEPLTMSQQHGALAGRGAPPLDESIVRSRRRRPVELKLPAEEPVSQRRHG